MLFCVVCVPRRGVLYCFVLCWCRVVERCGENVLMCVSLCCGVVFVLWCVGVLCCVVLCCCVLVCAVRCVA